MTAALFLTVAALSVPLAPPCMIGRPIVPGELVRAADAIVRVTAVDYLTPPSNPKVFTTGVPDSVVRFKVNEVLKGQPGQEIRLPGYLSDRDDFNDHAAPYTFVRPGGRAGSCIANSYRRGGEFLLMLQKSGDGLTVNWYGLAPLNEQLTSVEDPWLLWVRREVNR